jgi:uncharacterized membrane protein
LFRLRILAAAVFLVVLAGCGSGDLTLEQADPNAVAQAPSWESVNAIFQRQCVPCHTDDSAAEDLRYGPDAGANVTAGGTSPGLETCEAIIENFPECYQRIFVTNDMPPGAWPRLTSEEKLTIQRWFDAGEDAPCK